MLCVRGSLNLIFAALLQTTVTTPSCKPNLQPPICQDNPSRRYSPKSNPDSVVVYAAPKGAEAIVQIIRRLLKIASVKSRFC